MFSAYDLRFCERLEAVDVFSPFFRNVLPIPSFLLRAMSFFYVEIDKWMRFIRDDISYKLTNQMCVPIDHVALKDLSGWRVILHIPLVSIQYSVVQNIEMILEYDTLKGVVL